MSFRGLKRGSEDVSINIYASVDGETNVINEAWWTSAGFAGVDLKERPERISETTKLNASRN